MTRRGFHNDNLETSIQRLHRGKTYNDQTMCIVVPTRGKIPAPVVASWMGIMRPMNQICTNPIFMQGFEVGDAYNKAVEWVLGYNEQVKAANGRPFRYMLTLEDDNTPPPDGILKLLESIEGYDAVGGLYWTKGEGGQPMIYGDPAVLPKTFTPQYPRPDTVQHCHGLGMGFTLFRVALFEKMASDMPRNQHGVRQWFVTQQSWSPDKGGMAFTQDLWFFDQAAKYGGKFACDTRVRVGHFDADNDMTW